MRPDASSTIDPSPPAPDQPAPDQPAPDQPNPDSPATNRLARARRLLLALLCVALPLSAHLLRRPLAERRLRAAERAWSRGHRQRTLAHLDDAVRLAPRWARLRVVRGVIRRIAGDLAGAHDDLTRAAHLDPTASAPLAQRARVHLDGGHIAAALADDQAALRRDPHDAQALVHRGYIRGHLQDRLDAAIADCDAALAARPRYAKAINNRGAFRYLQGDLAGAEQDFRHAICWRPDHLQAHVGLGRVLHEMGRHDDAARILARAVDLDPRHGPARSNRARALLALGRAGRALAQLEVALALSPDDPTYQQLRVDILRTLRR